MAWKEKVAKCCLIPQRYIMSIMACLAIFNAYTLRVCLSLAITEMVKNTHLHNITSSNCPVEENKTTINTVLNNDILYDWDEREQGIILSSFAWGYIITHLPGGMMAERFGAKHILGMCVFVPAVLTLLTPIIIQASKGNVWVLTVIRIVEGLGEGPSYPAVTVILGHWIPDKEKSGMSSLVFAGSQLGTIVSYWLSGELIRATKNWDIVFYVFGGLAVLWYIFWLLLCFSTPNTHPFISEKERQYLNNELSEHITSGEKKVPWRAILTSMPVWAFTAAQLGHDWGFYTMVVDLPKYMKSVLKFDVTENGLWSSLPSFCMLIVAVSSGYLCDFLIKKNHLSVINTRRIFTIIGSIGPATFMIAAVYSGCDKYLAVAMFTLALSTMGTFYTGTKVNALDLSPNFAGTLMAVANAIGVIAGILAPYLVGELAPDQTLEQWLLIFWINFAIFIVTTLIFLIFASGSRQPWNVLESKGDEGELNRSAAGRSSIIIN